jgi:hypothetical protein
LCRDSQPIANCQPNSFLSHVKRKNSSRHHIRVPCAAYCSVGSVKEKTAPAPASDSTQIRPP